MELRGLAALVVVVALAPATVAAQQAAGSGAESGSVESRGSGSTNNASTNNASTNKVAADPHELGSDVKREPRAAPPPFLHGGIGARIGYGWAYADGVPDAYLLRLDYEAFFVIAPRHTVGGMGGLIYGFDWWRAGDKVPNNWGFGMPMAVVVGMRAVVVRGYVGFGLNLITVDQIDDDTGFGFCSPLAIANVGLDIYGVHAALDTRLSRRWQIGSPDITQWMFSIMIGGTIETRRSRSAQRN